MSDTTTRAAPMSSADVNRYMPVVMPGSGSATMIKLDFGRFVLAEDYDALYAGIALCLYFGRLACGRITGGIITYPDGCARVVLGVGEVEYGVGANEYPAPGCEVSTLWFSPRGMDAPVVQLAFTNMQVLADLVEYLREQFGLAPVPPAAVAEVPYAEHAFNLFVALEYAVKHAPDLASVPGIRDALAEYKACAYATPAPVAPKVPDGLVDTLLKFNAWRKGEINEWNVGTSGPDPQEITKAIDDACNLLAASPATVAQEVPDDVAMDSARYRWLVNRVLACDYGDNDAPGEQIGWRIRNNLLPKNGGRQPAFMYGKSVNEAIDDAILAAAQAQEGK